MPVPSNNDAAITEAAPAILARKLGMVTGPDAHPYAARFAHLTCADIARAVARASGRPAAALTTSDLAPVLGEAVGMVVAQAYDTAAQHLRIAQPIGLADYRETQFPRLDIDLDDDAPAKDENGEWHYAALFVRPGLAARVRLWGRLLSFSADAVMNDQVGVYQAALTALGAWLARRDARIVYRVLVDNPELKDGRALFNETDGNLMPGAALSKTTLATAIGKLRRQPTGAGNASGAAARHLVVAPEIELEAMQLAASVEIGDEAPISVLSAPEIPDGDWFLLADPAVAPVIGRLTLSGQRSIRVTEGRLSFATSNIGLRVEQALGAVALGRIGAIAATAGS